MLEERGDMSFILPLLVKAVAWICLQHRSAPSERVCAAFATPPYQALYSNYCKADERVSKRLLLVHNQNIAPSECVKW